ncbi:hypothetical protein YPPY76_1141, partial [Yersinia pestis PY-76]
MTPTT